MGTTFLTGAIVTIIHTSAMLLGMGTIATVIYEKSAARFCAAPGSISI